MKSATKKEIRSIDGILEMINSHRNDHYVYRGECSTEFALKPKVGRAIFAKGVDPEDYEKTTLHEFRRRCSPYLKTLPSSEIEWMALAQHHGMATRLLDWSENPMVAAFFACGNGLTDRDAVIHALPTDCMIYADENEAPFKISKVMLYEPNHISPRIAAQRGLFSVHPAPNTTFFVKHMEKWVIRKSAIIELAVTLDGFGFNQETMFPGLDGIAQRLNLDYFVF